MFNNVLKILFVWNKMFFGNSNMKLILMEVLYIHLCAMQEHKFLKHIKDQLLLSTI